MKKYSIAIIGVIIVSIVFITIHILSKQKGGNNYTVKLDANATTNYFWNYEFSEEGIVEVVKDEYIEDTNSEELVGVGGTQVYEFKGLTEGEVIITFKYQQNGSDEIAEIKTVTLTVDKNLNVTEND